MKYGSYQKGRKKEEKTNQGQHFTQCRWTMATWRALCLHHKVIHAISLFPDRLYDLKAEAQPHGCNNMHLLTLPLLSKQIPVTFHLFCFLHLSSPSVAVGGV